MTSRKLIRGGNIVKFRGDIFWIGYESRWDGIPMLIGITKYRIMLKQFGYEECDPLAMTNEILCSCKFDNTLVEIWKHPNWEEYFVFDLQTGEKHEFQAVHQLQNIYQDVTKKELSFDIYPIDKQLPIV